jgi:hypothetical protein
VEFWDFGAREPVMAPPAGQVCRMPTPEAMKRERERFSKATRG